MIPVYNQILTKEDAEAVKNVVLSQYITHIGKETAIIHYINIHVYNI